MLYKLMLVLILAYGWISSAQAATDPVDNKCYRLSENPQNFSSCEEYKYDWTVVYFEDFNGKDIKAKVKRQFRRSAPSVLINAQYDFEAECSSSSCDIQQTSDNVLLAFQRAVRTDGFYVPGVVDAEVLRPCSSGSACLGSQQSRVPVPQAKVVAQKENKAETINSPGNTTKDTVGTATEVNSDTADGVEELKIIVVTNLGKLIGTCISDGKICETDLRVKADSDTYHQSISESPLSADGVALEANLDLWLMKNRPQLLCTILTKTYVAEGAKVRTTNRTCEPSSL